jgi:hypothetical protein
MSTFEMHDHLERIREVQAQAFRMEMSRNEKLTLLMTLFLKRLALLEAFAFQDERCQQAFDEVKESLVESAAAMLELF